MKRNIVHIWGAKGANECIELFSSVSVEGVAQRTISQLIDMDFITAFGSIKSSQCPNWSCTNDDDLLLVSMRFHDEVCKIRSPKQKEEGQILTTVIDLLRGKKYHMMTPELRVLSVFFSVTGRTVKLFVYI
jgi:hypothetical protein